MSYMESKMQDQIDGAVALEQSICNEACDVYKETGQTPRQLADQVKVLREALTVAVNQNELDMQMTGEELRKACAALAATEWGMP